MQSLKLSIVIPVYNVKEYLNRCIASVENQDYQDYEIIIVDDGSTDGSSELCDELSNKHNNILVFHKENGGLSSARNYGIKHAKGQYLMLLDSDDWIEQGSLLKFSSLFDYNYDLIMGRAWTIDDEGHKKSKISYHIKTGAYNVSDSIREITSGEVTFCSQFYLYRRDYLISQSLSFREGILHEDELWMPMALLNAKTLYVSDIYFYYHYIRTGSIMHSSNYEKSAQSTLIVCEALINEFKNYPNNMTAHMRNRIAMLFLRAVPQLNEPEKAIAKYGKTMPLKYSMFGKQKLKSLLFFIAPKTYCKHIKKIRGYV